MTTIPKPKFRIQYNGKELTDDLTPYLISITYTDKTIGESDELEIVLEDTDGLWRQTWYPTSGDLVNLKMGYDDLILDCGAFRIDEINLDGSTESGDTVTLKFLATWVTSPLRTRAHKAYENQTLRQIAQAVATKNGLTLDDGSTDTTKRAVTDISKEKAQIEYEAKYLQGIVNGTDGTIGGGLDGSSMNLKTVGDSLTKKGFTKEGLQVLDVSVKFETAADSNDRVKRQKAINTECPILLNISKSLKPKVVIIPGAYNGLLYTIRIARSTQNNETDLAYLKRLFDEYGFIFTIQGTKMVVQSMFDIEAGLPVLEIFRTDLMSYSLKDKTSLSYNEVKVVSHSPAHRKTISYSITNVKNMDGVEFKEVSSADVNMIHSRTENQQQAEHKAKVSLYKSKTQQIEGTLALEGNPLLVAGNNFILQDMGVLSGKYHIIKSTHTGNREGGYTTSLEIKRVGYVQLVRAKPKHKRKVKYNVEVIK